MLVQQLQIKSKESPEFVYPHYDENCISKIPDAILSYFKAQKWGLETEDNEFLPEKVNKIVLIVIDGFGFNQFLRCYKENPLLTDLVTQGEAFPLTSVFPSQTTNALTTLNTGLTPQQHGLFEYFIFLKSIGIVDTLRFKRITEKKSESLLEEGFDPNILFRNTTIHETLSNNGINCYSHLHSSNALSICSKLIFRGSRIVPSVKSSDNITALRKNLEDNTGKRAFSFVHLDTLDTISHVYGPGSDEYFAELSLLTYLLKTELLQKLDGKTAKETLLLITSDHGAVRVNPEETTYLNYLPKTVLNLKNGADRKPIMPTGSPREVFLHIKEGKLAETKEWLVSKIGDKAKIIETKEAAERGFFGSGTPSGEVLERIGNLLILPCGNETVWFESSETDKLTYLGQHGGLSGQEMLVPFCVASANSLKR